MISTGVAVRGRDLRPVHRRRARAAGQLERRHRGRRVGRHACWPKLQAAEMPLVVPDGAAARPRPSRASSPSTSAATARSRRAAAIADVHAPTGIEVWAPLKMPIVLQAATSRSKYGLPQSKVKVHVVHRRRLVRPAPVQRRRARGRRGVQGLRQAGEADVVTHRRLPAGPDAPDVHLAGAGHLARRQRAHLRAAAHRASPPTSPHGLGEILTAFVGQAARRGNFTLRRSRSSS